MPLFAVADAADTLFPQNSLFFSLLAGNSRTETGSHATACAAKTAFCAGRRTRLSCMGEAGAAALSLNAIFRAMGLRLPLPPQDRLPKGIEFALDRAVE
jgi:hypothetical protein